MILELNSTVIIELFHLFFLIIICAIIFNDRIRFTSIKSKFLLKILFINLMFESIERLYEIKFGSYIIPTKYYYFSISETIFYSFLIETLRIKSRYIYPIIITHIVGINVLYNQYYPPYFLAFDYVYKLIMLLYFYFELKAFVRDKSKRFFIQNKFFIYFLFTLMFVCFAYYISHSLYMIAFYFFPNLIKEVTYLDGLIGVFSLLFFRYLIKQKVSFKIKEIKKRSIVLNSKKVKSIIYNLKEKKDFDKLTELIMFRGIYKNSKVTISHISSITEMHTKYISKLINTFTEGNFNDFINRLRIEEFKKNLDKKDYKNYSILGVAKESGFSSKSTFYKAFKKHEKMNPSEYMKIFHDEKNNYGA